MSRDSRTSRAGPWPSASASVVWGSAVLVAFVSSRYFLPQPPFLGPPELNAFFRHPWALRLHAAGGVVALLVGLFQFRDALRQARPKLHRRLGVVYLCAVGVTSATGLPLSWWSIQGMPEAVRGRLLPMATAFAGLAVTCAFCSALAYRCARAGRYREHRAWMLRSYSLIFAAVSQRLVFGALAGLPLSPVLTLNLAIASWPFNLVVAEWIVRRGPRAALGAARPATV